ncbi:hypothetical protein FIU97_02990 [Roseivivax sp. THAF40]|nr:hypothetical protein FIV09_02730 [Roseivivax sp. THAF197b]QFT45532.1 hypothetical protein FIU97_02990 [Roseivivax sp. THAF40]
MNAVDPVNSVDPMNAVDAMDPVNPMDAMNAECGHTDYSPFQFPGPTLPASADFPKLEGRGRTVLTKISRRNRAICGYAQSC